MEEIVNTLKRASPPVVAIIIVGWITTTFLEIDTLSWMHLLAYCLALAAICYFYIGSSDVFGQPPKE